jgi:hypothetical protein
MARVGTMERQRWCASLVGCIALVLLSSCGGSAPSPLPTGAPAAPQTSAPLQAPTATPTPMVGPTVTVQIQELTGTWSYGFAATQPELLPQVGQQAASPGAYWLYVVVDVYNEQTDRSALDPSDSLVATMGGCGPPGTGNCEDCGSSNVSPSCTPNWYDGHQFLSLICAEDSLNHAGTLIPANSYVRTELCLTQVAAIPPDLELWIQDSEFGKYTEIPVPS